MEALSLAEEKERLKALIPDDLRQYCLEDDTVTSIQYPVLSYPEKVTNLKLDKVHEIEKQLVGIKE